MLLDKDIREALFDFLELKYGKIRIFEELNIGASRADIIMVTEAGLTGIEIKSDADTYTRLSRQVKDYDQYCDYNIVVVGSSHAMRIEEHVPSHWGIITVELLGKYLDFYVLKDPKKNAIVTWKKKLELLWRPELFSIQESFEMPKYKDKSKKFVIDKICEWVEKEKISVSELHRIYCELLFERDYTIVDEVLAEYRKGELRKKLEAEDDPAKQIALIEEIKEKRTNIKKAKRGLRRKRK